MPALFLPKRSKKSGYITEKQISALISKCSGLEKRTSRLQSEVDVLIIDLEKHHRKQLELINIEFKFKLDEIELTVLYYASKRDNHQLTRENKKFGDENAELKSQYSELNCRFHELDIEYRRLENEREKLAYKEIQRLYARKGEEYRVQLMELQLR
ncbi:hypothetical protein GHT06_009903 [Daphnia sinensis]|uniref:Uncharacterized protein n=1 Tax=Daphnia sinensis TaxID=1820382 RepID=A0AAD5Q0M2_9CRUS|nr:hypothetical protein GHT06_009903 [Daphnia sinensis]